MSSKRKETSKGASSSVPPPYDPHRYVNAEAFQRYQVSVLHRTLIPERGILELGAFHLDITREIVARKWERFVKQPDLAVVPLVREFYANAPDRVGDEVLVRGRKVSFSRTTINRLYNLQNINDNEFSALRNGDGIDSNAILQIVCIPGAAWKMDGTQILSIKQSSLGRTSKAWMSFLCAKLLPVMRLDDVVLDRILVIYAIMTGIPIDVGSLIHNHICKILKGPITGGLGYPSMITELCEAAGVSWGPDEKLLHPQRSIDKILISSFKSSRSDCFSNPLVPAAASSSHVFHW